MQYHVIHHTSARRSAVNNHIYRGFVSSKYIQCQWALVPVNVVNGVIQGTIGHYRHNRAKYLFLHDKLVCVHIIQRSGGNIVSESSVVPPVTKLAPLSKASSIKLFTRG